MRDNVDARIRSIWLCAILCTNCEFQPLDAQFHDTTQVDWFGHNVCIISYTWHIALNMHDHGIMHVCINRNIKRALNFRGHFPVSINKDLRSNKKSEATNGHN